MRFLVDAQLPPELSRWLLGRGHEAAHVNDVLGERASDREIVAEALRIGAVIITKDGDFRTLAPASPPQMLFVLCGNASNAALRELFEAHFDTALAALASGQDVAEIG